MGFIIGFGVGMVAGITVAFILAVCSKNAYCNQIEEQERIKTMKDDMNRKFKETRKL